jgi:hypothetical protein
VRTDKLADNLEPRTELPEEKWREIEMAIGILEPNKLFRCRVEHFVEVALALAGSDPPSFGEAGGLKLSTVRKHLSKIYKDAQRLAETLSNLQARVELGDKDADWALFHSTRLWGQFLDQQYPGLFGPLVTKEQFPGVPEEWRSDPQHRIMLCAQRFAISVASYLATASERVMQSLGKSKGGTPKQDADFDELVCTLAILYRDVTGNKASVTWDEHKQRYSGAFLNFLLACCRAFAPSYAAKTTLAFGKALQRALKKLPDTA